MRDDGPDRASAARVYDYLLGGFHHFAVDRRLADAYLAAVPDVAVMARQNRAFLRRAVRYLAGAGIRQFLDLGAGLPTVGNVHEIAQAEAPGSRVVYVDQDPIAVALSQRLLKDNPDATVIRADLRRPDEVLDHPELRAMLDLDRPLAVLLVSVLHFVTDDPYAVVGRYRDRSAPGSHVVISHATGAHRPGDIERLRDLAAAAGISGTARDFAEILRLFRGYELLPPGLVWTAAWRPDQRDLRDEPERANMLAGVGRKD